jgi:hypothetical protein
MAADLQLGFNLPPASVLESLKIDIGDIRDLLMSARAEKAANEKRLRPNLVASKSSRCIRNEWTVDQRDRKFVFDKEKRSECWRRS